MMGSTLPAALLAGSLAFALAFAPRRAIAPAIGLLLVTAFAVSLLPTLALAPKLVFAACWISIIATAATVHLHGGPGFRIALALAANAGLWTGILAMLGDGPRTLVVALPAAFLALPAAWLVAHRGALAVKVAASWLVAVAILAAALPLVPTPGYAPDHME